MKHRKRLLPLSIQIYLFCLIFVFGYYLVRSSIQAKCTETTDATVYDFDINSYTDEDGDYQETTYYRYRYIVDGNTYTSITSRKYNIGDTIPVHYRPDNPNKHYINDSISLSGVLIGYTEAFLIYFMIFKFTKFLINRSNKNRQENIYENM